MNGYEPISKDDVLVVDEAGMIGTRQLARIVAKVSEIGAKLVLVGDPEQLQPIEAGTPFRDLVELHGAAHLTKIHRQKDAWQRHATSLLADGDVAAAVELHEQRGSVRRGRDAIEALAETFALDALSSSDGSQLALAHSRREVHAPNQAIQAALRPEASSQDVLIETETGPRAFASGDRIVFTRNDPEVGVKNGMLGTVEVASASRLSVRLDGGAQRTTTFDPRRYRDIDHGYATTIHKAQGVTVDRAYVLGSRAMDRHHTYVAMTRHRRDMRLFLEGDAGPAWSRSSQPSRRRTSERRRAGLEP